MDVAMITVVRNAIDTRGSTLGQRDLQNINLQQTQAAQAAIPQLNQSAALEAIRQGANPEQVNALAGLGIDATGQISRYGTNAQGDARYTAEGVERKLNRAEDVAYRNQQAKQQQENWKADSEFRTDESNWKRGGDVAQENPASSNLVFQDGKWATVNTPKISRVDAYGALAGAITGHESGNVANAKNPNSSATGAGQFIKSTWLSMMKNHRPELTKGKTEKEILAMRNDPKLAGEMTAQYAKNNAKGLESAGLQASDGNVYLAHFAGLGGAKALLKANPNASAESILGKDAADKNGKLIRGKTAGEVIQWAQNSMQKRMGNQATQSASQAINIPQSVAANAVSKYSGEITKLQNDFNLTTAKDQGTTTLGSKGQTIDSWLASKPVTDREGSTIFTDYASKVSKVARNNAKLSNLPMDSQLKVLDATHAWALAPGGVITDKELNKHIDNLVGSITTSNKRNLDQGRKNIFETQYQAFVADLNKAGQPAVDRDAFRALVDPQPVKPAPVKATPVVKESTNPFGEPSTATKAVQAVAPKKAEVPSYITNGAKINARNEALDQAKERLTNVANAPTRKELDALKAQALAKANTKRKEDDAKAAFKKLQEANKNKPLSPEMRKLLQRYG